MNKDQGIWLLFASFIFLGLLALAVEYVYKRFSVVGSILLALGLVGLLVDACLHEIKKGRVLG